MIALLALPKEVPLGSRSVGLDAIAPKTARPRLCSRDVTSVALCFLYYPSSYSKGPALGTVVQRKLRGF